VKAAILFIINLYLSFHFDLNVSSTFLQSNSYFIFINIYEVARKYILSHYTLLEGYRREQVVGEIHLYDL